MFSEREDKLNNEFAFQRSQSALQLNLMITNMTVAGEGVSNAHVQAGRGPWDIIDTSLTEHHIRVDGSIYARHGRLAAGPRLHHEETHRTVCQVPHPLKSQG